MKEKNTVCKEITKIASNALTLATGAALLYAGYKYGIDQGAGMALGLMKNWDRSRPISSGIIFWSRIPNS